MLYKYVLTSRFLFAKAYMFCKQKEYKSFMLSLTLYLILIEKKIKGNKVFAYWKAAKESWRKMSLRKGFLVSLQKSVPVLPTDNKAETTVTKTDGGEHFLRQTQYHV